MALIKCPDCGKMVSDRAQVCPDCGYPITEEVTRIQSMTENISSQSVSLEYNFKTEKEIAEKIYDELENGITPEINLYQAMLYKMNPDSEYLTILNESRDFSNAQDEQNEYIKENLYLMLEYLDYPLDEYGFRNFLDGVSKHKKKGFYQTNPYRISKKNSEKKVKYDNNFDRFKIYWEKSKAYCIYDVLQIGPWGKLIKTARKDIEGNPFQYVLILKRNIEKFEMLKKKTMDFLSKDDSLVFNPADVIFLYYTYDYNKVVIDEVQVKVNEYKALVSQYQLKLDETKHMNSIAGSIIGGALAGTTGAIIGSSIGRKNEEDYQYARQYNERIRKEQEAALELLKQENLPTKIVEENRLFYGIKTFIGIIPFYWDDKYEREYKKLWDKEHLFSAIEKWMDAYEEFDQDDKKSKYLIELRDKIARKFLETGEKWPEYELIWKNVKSDEEKLEEVAFRVANNLFESLCRSFDLDFCKRCVEQMEPLLIYVDEKYKDVKEFIKKSKNRINDINTYNVINRKFTDGKEKSRYQSGWEEAINLLYDVTKVNENEIFSEDIKQIVIPIKNEAIELYNTIRNKKEEADNIRNEETYTKALNGLNSNDQNILEDAWEKFRNLGNYKDSKQKSVECANRLEKIRGEIQKKYEKKKKFKKVRTIIVLIILISIIILRE